MDCSTPDFPVLHYPQELLKLMSMCGWCHPVILSSVTPFLLLPSILPSIRVVSMSWLFTSAGQSIGASTSASVFLMNIQGLELTGLISLLSKKLSKICSNTVRKPQFSGSQPSLASKSHIHTWLLENHSFDSMDLCRQSDVSVCLGLS